MSCHIRPVEPPSWWDQDHQLQIKGIPAENSVIGDACPLPAPADPVLDTELESFYHDADVLE